MRAEEKLLVGIVDDAINTDTPHGRTDKKD